MEIEEATLIRVTPTANDLHFAVVIGINRYPGYRDLQHAKRDAEDVFTWLRSTAGGNLPEGNVTCVIPTEDDEAGFAAPSDAWPTTQLVQHALEEFNRRVGEHVDERPEDWDRTRLYLYASGHGLAPDGGVAAVLMADVDASPHVESFGRNIEISFYETWYRSVGLFKEVVFLADCCRGRDVDARGAHPPWNTSSRARGRVTTAMGLATTFDALAFEDAAELGDAGRGFFTRALIEGLRGGAADPSTGEITTTSLGLYVALALPVICEGERRPQESSWPVDVAHPIVLRPATPDHKPLERQVTIRFPEGFAGDVELTGAADHGPHDASIGPWALSLQEGLYKAQLAGGGAPNPPFREDGKFGVYAKDRNVQL
jgi:hypothetical protein